MSHDKLTPAQQVAASLFHIGSSWISTKKLAAASREDLLYMPDGNRNHMYWLFGHIIVSTDCAPYINGSDRTVPDSYAPLFGLHSAPDPEGKGYPDINEMIELFDSIIDNSMKAIATISDHDLLKTPAKPLPEPLSKYFTTRISCINGFATHMAYHGGQISTILKMREK